LGTVYSLLSWKSRSILKVDSPVLNTALKKEEFIGEKIPALFSVFQGIVIK
jgi:hypothetical protein